MFFLRRLVSLPLVIGGLPAIGALTWRLLAGWHSPMRFLFFRIGDTEFVMRFLLYLSATAAILGSMLLISVYLAALFCGNDRRRLAAVFAPLVRGLSIGVAAAGLLQMVIAVLTFAVLMLAFVHVLPYGLVIAALVGGFYTVEELARLGIKLSEPVVINVNGTALTREAEPVIWGKLDEVAARIGARAPDHVVAGLAPGFFATGSRVCLPRQAILDGETMYLPVTSLRILSEAELAAVFGHELSHFIGADTDFTMRFVPIYQRLYDALVISHVTRGYGWLTAMPSRAILGEALWSFAKAERRIGRERELVADRIGSFAGSARDVLTAMLREQRAARVWETVVREVVVAIGAGAALPVAGERLRSLACDEPVVVGGAGEGPMDTHPDFAVRAQALGLAVTDVLPLAPAASPLAFELLQDGPRLEAELTDLLRDMLIRNRLARPPRDPNRPSFVEKKRLERVRQAEARRQRQEGVAMQDAERKVSR